MRGFTVGLILSALLIATGSAKAPLSETEAATAAEISGKYASNYASLTLTIDDLGHFEGLFERQNVFGQLQGEFIDRQIVGHWVADSGDHPCASEKLGSRYWGRVVLDFASENAFEGSFGYCGEAPSQPWSGSR
jgi:hypothetical protein